MSEDLKKTAHVFGVIGIIAGVALFKGVPDPNIRIAIGVITVVGCFGGLIMEFIYYKLKKKKIISSS